MSENVFWEQMDRFLIVTVVFTLFALQSGAEPAWVLVVLAALFTSTYMMVPRLTEGNDDE